jgi:hypothetical protein
MLPELLNIIGGTKVLAVDLQQPCHRPGQQAGAEDHQRAAQRQLPVVGEVEGFGGQRGEHQRRHQHVHADLVGDADVGTLDPAVPPADADDREDREDDGEDAQGEHRAMVTRNDRWRAGAGPLNPAHLHRQTPSPLMGEAWG